MIPKSSALGVDFIRTYYSSQGKYQELDCISLKCQIFVFNEEQRWKSICIMQWDQTGEEVSRGYKDICDRWKRTER